MDELSETETKLLVTTVYKSERLSTETFQYTSL